MSYADAAASSGPIGAEKIPEPTKVVQTETPSSTGNIETVPEDKFAELKRKTEAKLEERGVDTDKLKKDAKDFEKKAEKEASDFVACLQKKFSEASAYLSKFTARAGEETSKAAAYTSTELENPVVVLQVLAGLGGIVAGYVGYLERHRIRSDSNIVLGIHGAIITGLVGLDYYLFSTYYPKYDKKKSL